MGFTQTASTRCHAHSRRMWIAIGCFLAVGFLGLLSMKSNSAPAHRRLVTFREAVCLMAPVNGVIVRMDYRVQTLEDAISSGDVEAAKSKIGKVIAEIRQDRKIVYRAYNRI